ncbi:MAG TPA: lysophospholipid acyltransferase family protein [Candidatus Limnocylindrales bacterium]|nr:lysophospholipid acyltransferase family protein [Candidatus Limnocylindrales bacterium]
MFYAFFHGLFFIVSTLCFRLKVIGRSNIPKKGGVILASNHISYLDPPIIGCSIWRRVHYMAKEELFRHPVLRFFITRWQAFPVKRGGMDRAALKKAIEIVLQGEVLLMFPEGTRSSTGELQEGKLGVGMIAVKSKGVIIPTLIQGTDKILPRGKRFPRLNRVLIKFGKPIYIDQITHEGPSKELYIKVSTLIMEKIRELKQEVLDENKR